MRVHQITCPKCSATLKSKAGVPVGQVIPCPKCKRKFAVEDLDEADVIDDDVVDAEVVDDFEVEEPAPSRRKGTSPPPAPSRKNAPRRDEEDEDEDRKTTRRTSANGQAKKRRPRDDEDDDYERPRKKKRRHDDEEKELSLYRRLRNNIAVRIITWVILLTILAVAAYLLYEKKMAEKENAARHSPNLHSVA